MNKYLFCVVSFSPRPPSAIFQVFAFPTLLAPPAYPPCIHPPRPKKVLRIFQGFAIRHSPDALARSVAPLPLLVRSPLRFRSVASTRSALRLLFFHSWLARPLLGAGDVCGRSLNCSAMFLLFFLGVCALRWSLPPPARPVRSYPRAPNANPS